MQVTSKLADFQSHSSDCRPWRLTGASPLVFSEVKEAMLKCLDELSQRRHDTDKDGPPLSRYCHGSFASSQGYLNLSLRVTMPYPKLCTFPGRLYYITWYNRFLLSTGGDSDKWQSQISDNPTHYMIYCVLNRDLHGMGIAGIHGTSGNPTGMEANVAGFRVDGTKLCRISAGM